MRFFSTALTDVFLSLPLITVYLLYALGVVVIYRASRVLNLAHGAMAMVPAYLFYAVAKTGVPLPVAVVVAVAGGALLGLATETLVVRRLRRQGPTAQTVGTVAVFGLAVAIIAKVFGTAPLIAPSLFPQGIVSIGNSGLRYGQIIVFVVGLVLGGGLFALFQLTPIGLAMRGSADNRRGATLMGVNVDRTTQIAWAIGGGLAGMAGVLVGSLTNIHPFTLSFQVLPAFVAVLLGGLESLPGAVVGAAVVGLVQGEVPALSQLPGISDVAQSAGFSNLVLMVVTFVVMGLRGARLVGSRVKDEALATAGRTAAGFSAGMGSPIPALIAVVALAVFPFLPFVPFSLLSDAVLASFYVMVALSLVLLTGWVGQISLAQAELVGVGAFATAVMTNRFHIPFPVNFLLASLVGGLVAAALGMVALRVRGLYLAVATLVFAAMADNFLFNAPWMGVEGGAASIQVAALGSAKALPYFDFNDVRLIYFIFVAVAATGIYGLANLRESRTGRAFFAVRGSEVAAASLGINVTRYKLLAFLLAGMIAGAAGNLYIVYLRTVVPDSFNILTSLFFVSVAVVGGLLSLGGAVIAALVFAALHEVFFRVPQLAGLLNVVSSALLLLVLLVYPGGLSAAPAALAGMFKPLGRLKSLLPDFGKVGSAIEESASAVRSRIQIPARRVPAVSAPGNVPSDSVALIQEALARNQAAVAPALEVQPVAKPAADDSPWERYELDGRARHSGPRPDEVLLEASNVVVRFGGLTAVDDVSLRVCESEIVGLIGPNGAGKTTTFNAISGLNQPTTGEIRLFGRNVSELEVHKRAALGVARTFQDIQLFPQLTVFDNLLVATHLRNSSALTDHLVITGKGLTAEGQARSRVRLVLSFLGMSNLADKQIVDLSFGQLRMVEIARALVTGARLILLDEPASGLDNAESDRLAKLLLYVREELRVSMLVIEHDIRTVAGLCDYLYVLDQGKLLKDGRPDDILRDESVVNAYLGSPVPVGA